MLLIRNAAHRHFLWSVMAVSALYYLAGLVGGPVSIGSSSWRSPSCFCLAPPASV